MSTLRGLAGMRASSWRFAPGRCKLPAVGQSGSAGTRHHHGGGAGQVRRRGRPGLGLLVPVLCRGHARRHHHLRAAHADDGPGRACRTSRPCSRDDRSGTDRPATSTRARASAPQTASPQADSKGRRAGRTARRPGRPPVPRQQHQEGRGALSPGGEAGPDSAAPLVRLAQIALVRNQFAEAAAPPPGGRDRPAGLDRRPRPTSSRSTASPRSSPATWPGSSPIFRCIRTTETPGWCSGPQWYLSGRTARAADVFLRLDDPRRKPDVALAAFLQATNQR